MKTSLRSLAAGMFLFLLGLPAQADTIDNSFGLSSPATTLGFDEWGANGVAITNQYVGDGVVFTSTPSGPLVTLFSNGLPAMNQYALNQGGGSFQIQFQGTVNEAAFGFLTNPGTSTFTALRNGAIVEQFSRSTEYWGAADYFGFTGITFDTIEVTPGGAGQAFRLDNLQFGQVAIETPEPGSLALMLVALAGFGVVLRRRRA